LTPEPASVAPSVSVDPDPSRTEIVKKFEVPLPTPVPALVGAAVSVRLAPAVFMTTGKVASPVELVLSTPPDAIEPAEGVSVIEKLLSDTGLPYASSTWTVTEGDMVTPAKVFDGGCTPKASWDAAAALITVSDIPEPQVDTAELLLESPGNDVYHQ